MAKPVNPNATKKAEELLSYLYEVAGNGIITGQHTQTVDMRERDYLYELTGCFPKLQGFELLAYSPNICYEGASKECITEVEENKHTMTEAVRWAKENDGIVSICFHWFSPIGGKDKSFYTENTDFDPEQVLIEGTAEREAFFRDMKVIAKQLRRFQKEDIPVLWRPFHEAEGTWFWWGAKGHAVAKELYKLMFEYYTKEEHLDHLLWVWNAPVKDGYPGDAYVDVVSRDIYVKPYTKTDYRQEYEELIANTSPNKVAALAEVGVVPDVEMLKKSRVPWCYYMTWSKEFCMTEEYNKNEVVQNLYKDAYSVKL